MILAWTRQVRAAQVLDAMAAHLNVPMTLAAWLADLNAALPPHAHFQSPRQLAQFFRYVMRILPQTRPHYQLRRQVYRLADANLRTERTYYALVSATPGGAPSPPGRSARVRRRADVSR